MERFYGMDTFYFLTKQPYLEFENGKTTQQNTTFSKY